MPSDVHERTTRNRHRLADLLEGLDDDRWAAPTLCEGWTVHHLAAHLVQPVLAGFGRFFLVALRHRGDTAATVDHLARSIASRHRPAELVALLREHAGACLDPPRVGPMGPFVDTCIHLRDLARPLGLSADVPHEDWIAALDYLVAPGAAPGLVPPGRTEGLRLVATDADWARGSGPRVSGPLEALAMAVTGRGVALDDLSGPGVPRLGWRTGVPSSTMDP